ncbi:MAG: hypothetical protein AAB225_13495 [Acidobacteriota bacterium]
MLALLAIAGTLVLEDFETADAAKRWQGPIRITAERSAHGRQSARVDFDRGRVQVATSALPADWRGYGHHPRLRSHGLP